jgi:hypothetical protein
MRILVNPVRVHSGNGTNGHKRAGGILGALSLLAGIGVVPVLLPAAPASAAVLIPTFVQSTTVQGAGKASLTATLANPVSAGDRLIIEVAVWNSSGATAASVTDSATDPYTEITHFAASDGTEMSVWTAPDSSGGTAPTITAKPTSTADVGIAALDYAGLSTVTGVGAVDQQVHAVGVTTSAATVSSGVTPKATADNELALGLYADSGFGRALAAGTGFTPRANLSPNGIMQLLAEDEPVSTGANPAATFATGVNTIWLAATVVFQSAVQRAPDPPTSVVATPGNTAASVTWTPGASGGSPITSYVVTPFAGGVALTPTTVSGSPPAATATIVGLADGTSYTFRVTATNAVGASAASVASNAITPSTQPQGQWSALQTLPVTTVSTILMPNGKFIFWDGWQQPQPSVVWDLNNPTVSTTINAPDSVFCDGGALLPDGRVLVIGGYGALTTGQIGIVDTSIFDPSTNTWTRVANMHDPRWYPDLTELANGMYVALSGNSTDALHWADTPEEYDPATNTWTLLSGVTTPQVHEQEYPFSYLIPNGNIFTIGPAEDNSFELNAANQTWTPTGGASGILNGSSVMYRPGQILYTGGAASIDAGFAAQANAAVIDLTAATPKWQPVAPMNHARIYHNLTMLANGQVLAVGGEGTSDQSNVTTGVMPTEIWDPTTQTWIAAAPIAAARNYHSTAVLMPSGQVLVSGGGHFNGLNEAGQASEQVYSPSYLFAGPQPTITSAPASASYGSTIPITTPDAASIGSVNLVSLAADTHQIDMDQHFVPLSFAATANGLDIQAPSSGSLAPPGHYMLFVVKNNGVPSVASIISIGASSTPTAPGAPTAVAATAGYAAATVHWTAPAPGSSPITSYTVTPHIGSTPQTPVTVPGTPPPTSTTVDNLQGGTAYTFTVTATNSVGSSPASTASSPVTPLTPTAPGAPTGVTAAPGNGAATVSWTAPAANGSPITAYTVTPLGGGISLPPVTVSGSPPAPSATVTGLTNGTTYTFTVTATNAIGTSAASTSSNQVVPTAMTAPVFVQSIAAQAAAKTSLAVTPSSPVTAGDRLMVEVAVWRSSGATTSSVTDTAGDTYVELTHFTASDGTEMSVWTAVDSSGGSAPTITAKTTASADVGMAALEYAGLSSVTDATVVDQQAHAAGVTTSAATVSSGHTPATTAGNEEAIGFYADSGFSHALTAGTGFTARGNVSPNGTVQLMVEDQAVTTAATPAATFGTGANTIWLAAVVVLKAAIMTPPTAPYAPTGVTASASNTAATVSWAAPPTGGSPITSYTVTPYVGSVAQTATIVSGSPPQTSVTVTGLTNGTAYTFAITASNAVGTGPPSAASISVTPSAVAPPAFVQKVSSVGSAKTSLAVTPTANVTPGNRLVVEVGVWSAGGATTGKVADSVGDIFTEITQFVASDGTEMSVWTALVTHGPDQPIITATTTAPADVGVVAVEYSGLSTATGSAVVDQSMHATGKTVTSVAVSSGSTAATTSGPELALGFYLDSGFGSTLAGAPGYTSRANVSPSGTMQMLVEDTTVTAGASPAASVTTGADTIWSMATVVLEHA